MRTDAVAPAPSRCCSTDIKKGRRTLGMLCTGEVIVKEGEGPEGAAVAKGFPPVNDDAVEDGIAKEGDPKP